MSIRYSLLRGRLTNNSRIEYDFDCIRSNVQNRNSDKILMNDMQFNESQRQTQCETYLCENLFAQSNGCSFAWKLTSSA